MCIMRKYTSNLIIARSDVRIICWRGHIFAANLIDIGALVC